MLLFNNRLSGLSYTFLGHSLSSLLLPTLLLWFSVSNIPVLQIPVAFLSPFLFAGLLYFFFNYLSVNESSLFETSTLRSFMKKISSLATITLRVQFECKCQDCLFVCLFNFMQLKFTYSQSTDTAVFFSLPWLINRPLQVHVPYLSYLSFSSYSMIILLSNKAPTQKLHPIISLGGVIN